MQILSQQVPGFSLLGNWVNTTSKRKNGDTVFVELTFVSDTTVIVNTNPGNEFQHSYYVNNKPDFAVLHFTKEVGEDCMLPIILFKVINKDTIKVQVLHSDDALEWNQNEDSLNTGILKRKMK